MSGACFTIDHEESKQVLLRVQGEEDTAATYAAALVFLRGAHKQAMDFFANTARVAAAAEETAGKPGVSEPITPLLGPAADDLVSESSTEFEESSAKQPRLETE
jgi:hypothetical protein